MHRFNARLIAGVLLLITGVIFLLQNFNLWQAGDSLWAGLVALGGVLFLVEFLRNREAWWAIIPAGALLGLTATVIINLLLPSASWDGSVFLGALGVSFGIVYLQNRRHWWALIPGGVLLTLMVVTLLGPEPREVLVSGTLFLGLGLTFAMVALAPTPGQPQRWAFIPGGILALLGLLALAGALSAWSWLGPVGLIAVGLFLLFRAFGRREEKAK